MSTPPQNLIIILHRRRVKRKLIEFIINEVEIECYNINHMGVLVIFRDQTKEQWVFNDYYKDRYNYLVPDDPWHGKNDVPIEYEYVFNDIDDNSKQMKNLFLMRYRKWKKASWWEKRISIHRLAFKLQQDGWVPIDYHQNDLSKDLGRLTNAKLKWRHMNKGEFNIYGFYGGTRYIPGKMLIEQFTEWGNYGIMSPRRAWKYGKRLVRAIKRLLRYKSSVTRHLIMTSIYRAVYNINQAYHVTPNSYRTIIRLFSLGNSIMVDPFPGFGSKAIAATLEGCQYHTNYDFSMLANFLGTSFYPLDRTRYDFVILDYNWIDPGYERLCFDLNEWKTKCDYVIIYVPRHFAKSMPKPDKYVKARLIGRRDYVFYYA